MCLSHIERLKRWRHNLSRHFYQTFGLREEKGFWKLMGHWQHNQYLNMWVFQHGQVCVVHWWRWSSWCHVYLLISEITCICLSVFLYHWFDPPNAGRLILTDHALYFEALRVVTYDKPKVYELAEDLKQVVKPELTGPWGSRLFVKAVMYKSTTL